MRLFVNMAQRWEQFGLISLLLALVPDLKIGAIQTRRVNPALVTFFEITFVWSTSGFALSVTHKCWSRGKFDDILILIPRST